VLATLLLREGAPVSSAELIDALWGDDVPLSAVHVVRSYLHRLRKVVDPGGSVEGPTIVSARRGYLIRTTPECFDLAEFAALAAAAREASKSGGHARALELLNEGLGLWRGTALAGVDGQFVDLERRRLETMRLAALEAKAIAQVELGDYGDAEALLVRLVGEHPLNEQFRELLMLSLYRHGRQSESLEVYREAHELLDRDLGVRPGHRLRSLHERILQADPVLLAATRRNTSAAECEQGSSAMAEVPDTSLPKQAPVISDSRAISGLRTAMTSRRRTITTPGANPDRGLERLAGHLAARQADVRELRIRDHQDHGPVRPLQEPPQQLQARWYPLQPLGLTTTLTDAGRRLPRATA
jgi:DNA-binding SARP family transcriptional activator